MNASACVSQSQNSTSRNLAECFRETFEKESKDKLSDINHCHDYETLIREDERTDSNNHKLSHNDGTEKAYPLLSPGGFYIDNDPPDTISPTPEKQITRSKVLMASVCENEDRFKRQDNFADIKGTLNFNTDQDNNLPYKANLNESRSKECKSSISNKQINCWMQSKQNEKENRAHHRKPSQYSLISNNLQSNINQANTYRDFENSNKNNCYFIKSGQNLNQEANKFVCNKNLQDSPQQNPITVFDVVQSPPLCLVPL